MIQPHVQLRLSSAPPGFFEDSGLAAKDVYVNASGHVFARMSDVLHPGDLAYWWDHPGLMLLLEDVKVRQPLVATSTCTVYWGATRLDAYKAAASCHRNMAHLLREVANGNTAVVYWCWNVGKSNWEFGMKKVSVDNVNAWHA